MNRVFSFGLYPSRSIWTGSRCTTLTKSPVAFWGGSNASVDPVPIVNPATRPLNTCRPPYISTYRSTGLADAQIAQLSFLEIGIDPDVAE